MGYNLFMQDAHPRVEIPASPWFHTGALVLYAAISWLILDHGAPLTGHVLGTGADPTLIMWFFAWWPYAISHHLDPLFTTLVWQPLGLNLAWTTNVPLLSFLALPFTLTLGPGVAFNVLTLAGTALAAWGAYLLCLELTEAPWAALAGGYVFGFSSYQMAEAIDHLNLHFTVFIPLLLLLAVRFARGRLGAVKAAALMALCMAGQFMISTEIALAATVFGGMAWLVALLAWRERRAALLRLAGIVCLAGAGAMILVSPFLWAMLAGRHDLKFPFGWSVFWGSDLTSFFLPTAMFAFGGTFWTFATTHYVNFIDEQGAYIGLPLLAVICLFAIEGRRKPGTWFLLAMLAMVAVASMGPALWLAGHFIRVPLPWYPSMFIPFLSQAEPDRFVLFMWLAIAVILASWLARNGAAARGRWLLAALGGLFILPLPHPVHALPDDPLFRPGQLQAVIGQDRKVLFLPYGFFGHSTYWQQENQFGFTQTDAYLGYPPRDNAVEPAMRQIIRRRYDPSFAADLKDFCQRTGTQYVIAEDHLDPPARAALQALGWPGRRVGDVTIFTVPGAAHG